MGHLRRMTCQMGDVPVNMYSLALLTAAQIISAALAIAPDPNSYRCPNGYHFSVGKCYKIVADAKDYAEAQTHCESTGGTLASPNSQEELDAILQLASQHPAQVPSLWLGYTDEGHEGMFTDNFGKVLTHAPFPQGEPNNCCGGEHCLQLFKNGLLNDMGCHRKLNFVCSACVQDERCRCPALWHEHAGHCYRFFGRRRSFEDGEAHCQSYHNGHGQSAHLASVSCRAENNFITDIIDQSWPGQGLKRAWLGFTDKQHEGNFEWTDQSKVEYTNWKSGEPSNGGNKDCVVINFMAVGKWNDISCQLKRSSVCKMPVFDPYRACHKLADIIEDLIGKCDAAVPAK
ncbi:macrophage mannose receptor 1-like [Acanthaster planci]|uniref:Macrophage mannose receptor 1-like n=1 Tax=Acanthaster planci TaxID=133434 RepID=A0A8B7Z0E1_ACAPL|nr:macrophage mannose receptor 1-like [Acanthaster planci]